MIDQQPLEERLHALERRLETLERLLAAGVPGLSAAHSATEIDTRDSLIGTSSLVSIAGQVGRTLMVLGGAFLIRFMTESTLLPQMAGTLAGIAYALVWVAFADRAARRNAYESATFHGVSAAAIGFPLLWETTLTFKYLTPLQSAAAVTVFTALPLAVAWRREMRSFAVVIAAPAAITMLALGFATSTLPPFLGALLVLAQVSLALAYGREWYVLGAFVAIVADFAIALATTVWLYRPHDGAVASLGAVGLSLAQVALGGVYLGTFSLRVFPGKRNLALAEIAQVAVVLLIALGGFVGTALRLPAAQPFLCMTAFALAASSYVAAYYWIDDSKHSGRTFGVYSTIALATALVATRLGFASPSLAMALALGALLCAVSARRRDSLSLSIHSAVYILAGALVSGLLGSSLRALWGSGRLPELLQGPAPWIVLLVSLLICLTPTASPQSQQRMAYARLPVLALTVLGAGALVVALALGIGSEVGETELARSSVLRSTVISSSAVLLALLSRHPRFKQARWLVVPFLLLGAAKLVAQDLPSGEPSILFASLGIFGAALILAPRLLSSSAAHPENKHNAAATRAAEYSAPS
ncbi:MAG: hypothetical protein HY270_13910 [Deltaproteobacteria bacterium]|nr:hypothetical protein [Deltaproteobacteria bacterium]